MKIYHFIRFYEKCEVQKLEKYHVGTAVARSFDCDRSQSTKIKTQVGRSESVLFQDQYIEPRTTIFKDFFIFEQFVTKKYVAQKLKKYFV